ncbi:uncharacterized protein Tco025E_00727 [Trypanosoma conorhini]|uniref:Uncharacterized protein n=1 Tax=Trypanosoma conorhini TaxID=83891 RepID=A0A3R7P0W7_9TRYP|nr:uncharacterized protein Tco025E_00727 [Trypanosoma conorhini]RNF27069.1 hypothetical protein Tco025E_00727 [Trypanosoma conorhini]
MYDLHVCLFVSAFLLLLSLTTMPACRLSSPIPRKQNAAQMLTRLGAGKSSPHHGAVAVQRCFFYAGLDESRVRRLRRASTTFNKPRGRDTLSLAFERRVRVLPLLGAGDMYAAPAASSAAADCGAAGASRRPLRVLVVELLSLGDVEAVVPYPAPHPTYYAGWTDDGQPHAAAKTPGASPFLVSGRGRMLLPGNKMQLRQNGDTSLLRGTFTRRGASHGDTEYAVALCIDPYLDLGRFRREEAQVELICGYRNVLYEAVELPGGPADVVRIPALSCDTCGENLRHELGKLSQQALIKGFHRISNEAKESLIVNPRFRVEVYVPPRLLEEFGRAFLEDAWETPESTIDPGRTALYPGLPPPRTLLEADGWIGKRRELVEAVETEGRSLMRGTQRALDGTAIAPREVLTDIRVFGREREQQVMLEGERETAAKEGYDATGDGHPASIAPRRPGINQ